MREDGAKLKLSGGCVDTGFALALRQTYAFVRTRQGQGWRAVKGSSIIDCPMVARARASKVDQVFLLMIGTNRIKSVIYDRALLAAPADGGETPAGYMHFPSTYSDEWFRQLLCEDSFPVFKRGVMFREFKVPQGAGKSKRNEALDMRVYAMASLINQGFPNWDEAEKRNLDTIRGEKPPAPKRAPGRGWAV